ncbi:hypothetical protein Tco_0377751, partial [Tanacetum coccineum]
RQAFEEEKRNVASQKRAAQATSINKLSTVSVVMSEHSDINFTGTGYLHPPSPSLNDPDSMITLFPTVVRTRINGKVSLTRLIDDLLALDSNSFYSGGGGGGSVDVVSVVSVTLEGTSADAVRALKIWEFVGFRVKLFIPDSRVSTTPIFHLLSNEIGVVLSMCLDRGAGHYIAMYSASVVEMAVLLCFFDDQLTKSSIRKLSTSDINMISSYTLLHSKLPMSGLPGCKITIQKSSFDIHLVDDSYFLVATWQMNISDGQLSVKLEQNDSSNQSPSSLKISLCN